jgi:hypothetical protein
MILRTYGYLMIILCLEMKERSRRHMEEGLEAWRSSKGGQIKMEVQTKLSYLIVQEQSALKWSPRSYTGSDLDVLDMHGKLTRRHFQWFLLEAQIDPESSGIIRAS